MKKNKQIIGLNIFIIVIAIVYAAIMILGNVRVVKSSVATISGSYGEQYAMEHKLNQVSLADSEQIYFDYRYEVFDYNIDAGNITLEKYEGKSSELVIPSSIGGVKVTTLGEDFISSLDTVKEIYVSGNVTKIMGNADASVRIYCPEDSALVSDYEESGWNVETIYDSDFINFNLGDMPFQYNLNGMTVEITRYMGDDELLIIPSYVNGYPVTTIGFDILGAADIIVIPETVTDITGISSKALYSPTFMVELIFTILAFVIALITVNVLLPRYRKNADEYLLTGNQMIAVILYVIMQTIFSIVTTYFLKLSVLFVLIISLIIIAVFVAIIMLGEIGRGHVKEVEARVAEKTSRMKAIKVSAKNISGGIKNPELRKQVQRLEDEIRFSDPVSRCDLDDIESEIEESIFKLKKSISDGNEEEIKNVTERTMKIVTERNVRCKSDK